MFSCSTPDIYFVLQRIVSVIIVLSNQAPEILVLLWILSLTIKNRYCSIESLYCSLFTRNNCSCSGECRVIMEIVFPIFQGNPGLDGPPGMRGRNGDDVSDIDVQ